MTTPPLSAHRSAASFAMLGCFAFVLTTLWLPECNAETLPCFDVEVQNVRPGQGMLMIAAYSDAENFSKTAVVALQLRASNATMRFPICGVSGPLVGLTLFQDLDSNGKLDRNPFGVPTEPWGTSGRPAFMAPPSWESSQVPLDGRLIVVKLSQ